MGKTYLKPGTWRVAVRLAGTHSSVRSITISQSAHDEAEAKELAQIDFEIRTMSAFEDTETAPIFEGHGDE